MRSSSYSASETGGVVLLVVAPVVPGDLLGEPGELGLGLGRGEVFDRLHLGRHGRFAHGRHRRILAALRPFHVRIDACETRRGAAGRARPGSRATSGRECASGAPAEPRGGGRRNRPGSTGRRSPKFRGASDSARRGDLAPGSALVPGCPQGPFSLEGAPAVVTGGLHPGFPHATAGETDVQRRSPLHRWTASGRRPSSQAGMSMMICDHSIAGQVTPSAEAASRSGRPEDQPVGGGAGLVGDGRAGEHAGDLLAARAARRGG